MTTPAPHEASGTTLVVPATDAGRRLDDFLADALAVGRRAAVRLASRVRVNGRYARKGDRLRGGDVLTVPPTDTAPDLPADATVAVLRETADVLAFLLWQTGAAGFELPGATATAAPRD
jgi:23S rRNA-/tRNA-specific pseudouridylate synthase